MLEKQEENRQMPWSGNSGYFPEYESFDSSYTAIFMCTVLRFFFSNYVQLQNIFRYCQIQSQQVLSKNQVSWIILQWK